MQKLAQQKANGGSGEVTTNNGPEDDMDVDDPDEPTYCYCNRVSFGEMVGCDGGECKREWFHLECVGLRNAPPKNSELPWPSSFDFCIPSLPPGPSCGSCVQSQEGWKNGDAKRHLIE